MLAKGSLITTVAVTTLQRLISKARRGRSGDLRLNSNDKWRLLIVVLYLLVMMYEATRSS